MIMLNRILCIYVCIYIYIYVYIYICIKVKGKIHPRTGHENPEGNRCTALLFLQTRRQMGVGGQRHAPADLPPGETWYPLYRRMGGPQGRSGRARKISPTPGFDSRTVHPVASCYTDWAIPTYITHQWKLSFFALCYRLAQLFIRQSH
jgi:hypothetical protein